MSEMPDYLRRYAEARLSAIDAHEAAREAARMEDARKAWAVFRSAVMRDLTGELGIDLAEQIARDCVPLDPPDRFDAAGREEWIRVFNLNEGAGVDDASVAVEAFYHRGDEGWTRSAVVGLPAFDPDNVGGPFIWAASFNHNSVACRDLPTALAWVLRRIR